LKAVITGDLVKEATHLLERWAKKRNLLPSGKQLLVTISIKSSATVELKINSQGSPDEIDELLSQPIEILQLSGRAMSPLKYSLFLVGDVARETGENLSRYRNFGKKSCDEVCRRLQRFGLTLGTKVPVGPREQEALLQGSIERFVFSNARAPLQAAGIIHVRDLLSKTEGEIISILAGCDLEGMSPRQIFQDIRRRLFLRGMTLPQG
jgi:hypothetical protein